MDIVKDKKFQKLVEHINKEVALSEDEEAFLVSKLRYKKYLKGQFIIQEDDIYKYQTYIISGKVKTFYMSDDGNEHIVAFGLENWWVGDICSFTTQTPAIFNTQCLDDTTVIHITYDDMNILYEKIPQLERYFRLIVQIAYGNATKRIVQNHAMPAKDRYLLFTETYPEIVQKVPQYMIASYLGITKEFLSTIRKQLTTK